MDRLPEVSSKDGLGWIPVVQFASRSEEIFAADIWNNTEDEKQFRFYVQTVNLVAELCKGRNRHVTDWMLNNADRFGYKYQDVLRMVFSRELPNKFKATLLTLLRALYIDREPCEDIPALNLIRVWPAVAPKCVENRWTKADPWAQFPGELRPTHRFSDLKDHMRSHFEANSGFDSERVELSKYTHELVNIAYQLLKFGFFFDEVGPRDLKQASEQLLEPLMGLLDGSNETIYIIEDRTKPIFNAKLTIGDIFIYMFDCRQERRLEMVFDFYIKEFEASDQKGTVEYFDEQRMADLSHSLFGVPLISSAVGLGKHPLVLNTFVKTLLSLVRFQYLPLVARAFSVCGSE